MYENANIEVIARGVCIQDGQILLCHAKKSTLTYLPGGHIEFGETGRIALAREMQEEMGVEARVGAFLGCCEHTFIQNGEPHCEINLIYEMTLPTVAPGIVDACESWIGFKWIDYTTLQDANLEPRALVEALDLWRSAPGLIESGFAGTHPL